MLSFFKSFADRSPAYSKLFFISDNAGWVLDNEVKEVSGVARSLGLNVYSESPQKSWYKQSAFFPSFYMLMRSKPYKWKWNVASSYFHGMPGCGNDEFDNRFDKLTAMHHHIQRLHVSNYPFKETILQSGISPEKVHVIPIGVNVDLFPLQTESLKSKVRKSLGIPDSAVVIGSFQKDGNGWQDGEEPKLIKGPDILLETLALLKTDVDNLHVLLSGPARGYVKAGLKRLGIPYLHHNVEDYQDMYKLYHCLDLYLVTSREEGGPKAVLESMATGIPLVTTRVGQARDLVNHGVNGWIADVNSVDELARHSLEVLSGSYDATSYVIESRKTAERNSYINQKELWRNFFKGFVTD